MQGVQLKEQISKLIDLQESDTQIFNLKDELEAKPDEIKKLETLIEEKKKKLADSEKKLHDLIKQRKDKELELATKEESAKKLESQLFSLKTNKEYSAMMKEIEGMKTDASILQDQILEILDKTDKEKENFDKEKQAFTQEEKRIKEEIEKIKGRIKEIEGFLSDLQAKREVKAAEVNSKILAQYERVLRNRDGLAIAKVFNDACSGCNMSVPPQVVNLIKMSDRIVSCEICQRILYLDENT